MTTFDVCALIIAAAIGVYAIVKWPVVRTDEDDWSSEPRYGIDGPPIFLMRNGTEFELEDFDGWDHESVVATLQQIEAL